MTKWFYDWEDTSDPYSTGVPDINRYPEFRLLSKRAVRAEWRAYLADLAFDKVKRKPKLRVWRIKYEEVTL